MIERSAHPREDVSPEKVKAKLSNSLGKKLKPHTIEVSSGDEKTLLDPINYAIRDARMAPNQEYQPKPKHKKSSGTRYDIDEPYHCPVPGCSNRFIHQAELDNHMTARHEKAEKPSSPRASHKVFPIPVRSRPRERKLSSDATKDDDDLEVKRPSPALPAVLHRDSTEDDLQSEIASSVSALSRMSMADSPASSTESMWTDTTDAALSDIAETESQEVQMPVRILIACWNKLVMRLFNSHAHGAGYENESYQRPGGRQNSRRASSNSLHKRSSSISSSTTSNKRPPSDDEDDDEGRKKPKLHNTTPLKDRPVGCPFNKYDNIQFGEGNQFYHVCSTWNSVKTAYLKQHLQRTHCPSPHCCPRCQTVFKSAALLQEHQRQTVPCGIQELDKQKIIPEHQELLGLRSRNAVGMDKEKYWFQVFDTVFPGERQKPNRIIDPYYKGPAHEVLERFLRFSEVRLPHALARARRELRIESDNTPEKDTELCRMILQEASLAFMDEMTNAPPVDLRQLNREASTLPVIDDTEAEETVKVYDPPPQPQPQPQPQPIINPSEADFAGMGQSTYLHVQQVSNPTAAHHQAPPQPSHPSDTVEPSLLTTQPYQQVSANDYGIIHLTGASLQQLLDDPNFTKEIESVDMYGPSDTDFHGFEYVERNP